VKEKRTRASKRVQKKTDAEETPEVEEKTAAATEE
jgi:hypothetical protein